MMTGASKGVAQWLGKCADLGDSNSSKGKNHWVIYPQLPKPLSLSMLMQGSSQQVSGGVVERRTLDEEDLGPHTDPKPPWNLREAAQSKGHIFQSVPFLLSSGARILEQKITRLVSKATIVACYAEDDPLFLYLDSELRFMVTFI
ncbi:hypothetical protein FXO37_06437 [Capsicum annuum]|nr:hypothetical protein FXO37_06437 [Capsicum annuum]